MTSIPVMKTCASMAFLYQLYIQIKECAEKIKEPQMQMTSIPVMKTCYVNMAFLYQLDIQFKDCAEKIKSLKFWIKIMPVTPPHSISSNIPSKSCQWKSFIWAVSTYWPSWQSKRGCSHSQAGVWCATTAHITFELASQRRRIQTGII